MNEIDLLFDQQHIWHPYTSMTLPLPCYPIHAAQGEKLILADGRELIDGMSSWWAAVHGYNHPKLNQAVVEQLAKVSHVMFGGLTHQPAIELCKKLVNLTPVGLECVFLADSGSVAVEVALKMACQYWQAKGEHRSKFIALRHAYHGDTFGAMAVCDPQNSMHSLYHSILPHHYFADAPRCGFSDVWDAADLDSLKQILSMHHQHIAALIVEPIVQGAGGMRIYHPEYLRQAKALCDEFKILLITDEIATGFGRTGKWFACEHANISPDIICVGKALTGGYMTLSATITTRHVADTISEGEAKCFMHGPTFMGNPLACAVANASILLLQESHALNRVKYIESRLFNLLSPLMHHEKVTDVRILGAIGVVELNGIIDIAKIQKIFVDNGVWIRPFGKLIYIMPPYIISDESLEKLCSAIAFALSFDFYK